MSNVHEVDVVIIGAGLAGLSAALELNKRNISFMVLEARERPGGRIYSIRTNENVMIDMGAQWIGKDHLRIKKLLSQFNLKTVLTNKKGKTVYSLAGKTTYGRKPPLSVSGFIDLIQFTNKLNKSSKQIVADAPWSSFFAKEYDKMTVEQYVQKNMYTASGRNFYKFLIEEMLCSNLHEVSALDVLWCIKTAGSVQRIHSSESLWINEGSGNLIAKMAEVVHPNISYENPVKVINYENNGATIFTAKEECWKAKRVIIAIPPNLQTKINFQPPLPALRAQLIERAGLPSVTKINIVYEKPFWREKGLSGIIYSDRGPINEAVDSSPKEGGNGVLTVLVTGDSARALRNPHQEILPPLVKFLGLEAAKPLEIYVENWSEQQWTRGGYGVHFPPGVITNYGKALMEPIATLHWAGTETATEWRLFMEGAVQSGERAAQEVFTYLQQGSRTKTN